MKILFAASEATPFAASGGLGDVVGSLPKALAQKGVSCRVVMPLYSNIPGHFREKMSYICHFNVVLGWRNQYCGVYQYNHDKVVFYFIDNEYYFKRDGMYGFYDEAERFAFFSKAILDIIEYIDYQPDILHCHDWQTAMVPVYFNMFYRNKEKYSKIKTIFTIHNVEYQGKYGMEILQDVLGLPESEKGLMQYDGCLNMVKAAIEACDKLTTVSPTYSDQLQTPLFGCGLDREFINQRHKFCGILNGIDYEINDPKTDPLIYKNYSCQDISGKDENRKKLCLEMDMSDDYRPVVGIVSRMVAHKGMDLIKLSLEHLICSGFKFVVLGSGEYAFESFFNDMHNRYPRQMAVYIGYNKPLSKKIYAGSDIFLMPSQSEHCGISQLIALRYGAIPVVRETGGLKDTITDCSFGQGNGFCFEKYNSDDMCGALFRAKNLYESRAVWELLVKHAMSCDFSWNESSTKYVFLYQDVLGLK